MNSEAIASPATTPTSAEQAVWQFLTENCDVQPEQGQGPTVVSHVRQEEIAERLDLSLSQVIEAIRQLQQHGRLQAERQDVGKPFRYLLDCERPAEQDAPARAA